MTFEQPTDRTTPLVHPDVPAVDPLTPEAIAAAAAGIGPEFLGSPQLEDAALSAALGRRTLLKIETLNPVRSFKGRGAECYMSSLANNEPRDSSNTAAPSGEPWDFSNTAAPSGEPRDFSNTAAPSGEPRDFSNMAAPSGEPRDFSNTVVCASAGNFGQAIAYAGAKRGIPVRVYAATTANPVKVERMRQLGAEVVLVGADFDTAKEAAAAYAAENPGARYVEDGREPAISAGAGTLGMELAAESAEPIDTLLVPVGNGALLAGVGCWFKRHSPDTRIVAVCAEGAPAMARSWAARRPVDTDAVDTIADGLAARVSIPIAVSWMLAYADDVLLVSEASIASALRTIRDRMGLLLEPAGASGVAAIVQHAGVLSGRLATILTGSNYSPDLLAELTGQAS